MKKYLFSLFILFISYSVQAHNPDISSTMLVEKEDNKWILQIRSALTGFDQVIKANYPAYESAEEFQALVLQHLKDNIQIDFNDGAKVTLENGGIKLGHETIAVFEVLGVPKSIQSVRVKNTSFSTINRNQNTLVILKKGFKKNRFTLNNKNQHTMNFKVADANFVPVDGSVSLPADVHSNYPYKGIALSFLGLFFMAFIYIKFIR